MKVWDGKGDHTLDRRMLPRMMGNKSKTEIGVMPEMLVTQELAEAEMLPVHVVQYLYWHWQAESAGMDGLGKVGRGWE